MKDLPSSFPLRLPRSTRERAIEVAQKEGLSLNQFITLAVTEKIVRLELMAEATLSKLPTTDNKGRQVPVADLSDG